MTWWQGLLIGLAIGLPSGALAVAVWFLGLVARLDSIDMADSIRVLKAQRGFFLGWQIVAALVGFVVVAGIVGFSRHQVTKCRAEVAEFRHAYDLLAQSVQRQNAAVLEAEGRAAEAARRGAQARAEAVPVVEAARRSADALAGELRGLRPPECPTGKAVELVREDLQR